VHFSTRGTVPETATPPVAARTIGARDEQLGEFGRNWAMDGTHNPLTDRDRAILRAVGRGTAELAVGTGPDLFLDGRCCADQVAAHRLTRAGLIAAAGPGVVGARVGARLTAAGRLAAAPDGGPATRPAATAVRPAPAAARPARPVPALAAIA
jgi:hypothetical protein